MNGEPLASRTLMSAPSSETRLYANISGSATTIVQMAIGKIIAGPLYDKKSPEVAAAKLCRRDGQQCAGDRAPTEVRP